MRPGRLVAAVLRSPRAWTWPGRRAERIRYPVAGRRAARPRDGVGLPLLHAAGHRAVESARLALESARLALLGAIRLGVVTARLAWLRAARLALASGRLSLLHARLARHAAGLAPRAATLASPRGSRARPL